MWCDFNNVFVHKVLKLICNKIFQGTEFKNILSIFYSDNKLESRQSRWVAGIFRVLECKYYLYKEQGPVRSE